MFFGRTQKDPTPALRLTALFAAALVMVLAVFSASPTLHAWLHGEAPGLGAPAAGHTPFGGAPAKGHDDSLCAVTIFAQGILAVTFLVLVARIEGRAPEIAFVLVDQHSPRAVRYRLPPHCGPPQV